MGLIDNKKIQDYKEKYAHRLNFVMFIRISDWNWKPI